MWTTTTCTVLGLVLLSRTLRDISTPVKTRVLVRLVCTLVPRSASVALYEQTSSIAPEPALLRDSEPSIAHVLALFGVVPAPLSSAGVLGGHILALLGAPHCILYDITVLLHCTVLYAVRYYCLTALFCAAPYCTVLYCAVLHCTVLYCDRQNRRSACV